MSFKRLLHMRLIRSNWFIAGSAVFVSDNKIYLLDQVDCKEQNENKSLFFVRSFDVSRGFKLAPLTLFTNENSIFMQFKSGNN